MFCENLSDFSVILSALPNVGIFFVLFYFIRLGTYSFCSLYKDLILTTIIELDTIFAGRQKLLSKSSLLIRKDTIKKKRLKINLDM